MKKILFVIYTHSLGGGAEKIFSNVLNGLADQTDYQLSVLEYAKYDVKNEALDPKINRLPPIVDMANSSRIERITKFLLAHLCPGILRKLYLKEKYDVEIAFNYQIPSFLTGSKKGVYNVQWNHGDVSDLKKNRFKRFLQGRAYQKADQIVAISENTRNSIVKLFPQYADKVTILYNGTDVDLIRKGAEMPTDVKLKNNSLVFLGRLEHNKNPLRLLGYTERLIKEGCDVNLYLLGSGVQDREVADYIKNAKLEDRVFPLGYVSNPYPIIKQGSAICLLSEREGFPTVFTEGMALGKPFISTPVGGTRELADHGNCGIVIDDYEGFKEAVHKTVIDRESSKKMGNACLERIKLFSLEKQIESIIDLIERK